MSFYIAMPTKVNNHNSEKLLVEILNCKIYEWQGRYFAYKDEYRIGELVNGKSSLDNRYKGSFEKWIKSIKNKDFKKINKMKEEANLILQQCNQLEKLWK